MSAIAKAYRAQHKPARSSKPTHDRRRLRGAYEGDTQNRYLEDWIISDRQPRELTAVTLTILRQRSRDLARHAPAFISGINVIVDNVVGSGGFRVNPAAQDASGEPLEDVNETLAELWKQWTCEVDKDQRESLTMLLRTGVQEYVEAGEVFFVQHPPPDRAQRVVRLAYEVVAAERVDHTFDRQRNSRDTTPGGNEITASIEYNADGQRVAYWLTKIGAFGELSAERERITADRVHHVFHRTRAGQERGVPWIAGAAVLTHDLDDLIDSELTTAQVAACLTGWIERAGSSVLPPSQERDADDNRPIHRFAPGMLFDLEPGESVNITDPNRPSGSFEPFANFITRSIARTLGVSYEALSGDWRRVNFASGRLGHLVERKTFRRIQDVIIQLVVRPMWVTFVRHAVAAGLVPGVRISDYVSDPRRFTKAEFGGAGWEHHDPLKEVTAAALRILAGLSTLDDECAALGRDYRAVMLQRTREIEAAKEAGIPPITIGGAQVITGQGSDGNPGFEPDDGEE